MSEGVNADFSDDGQAYDIKRRCQAWVSSHRCDKDAVLVFIRNDGDPWFLCAEHFLQRVEENRRLQQRNAVMQAVSESEAETENIAAEALPPRKPKVGDIVRCQLLSASLGGINERPAVVIGHGSGKGRLHLRGFFGPTDAIPGNSEADTFFANYGHHPGDWHWPEEDGLWM